MVSTTACDTMFALVPPQTPYCHICGDEVRPAASSLEGKVRWLPNCLQIPPDSCIFNTPQLQNPQSFTAFNHPTLPILISSCGHLVYCLGMTSFGSRGMDAKCAQMKGRYFDRSQYVELREDTTAIPENKETVLSLDGARLVRQSYICLREGFWIEIDNLRDFRSNCRINAESLESLAWLFIKVEQKRQSSLRPARANCEREMRQCQFSLTATAPLMPLAFASMLPDWCVAAEMSPFTIPMYAHEMATFTSCPETGDFHTQPAAVRPGIWFFPHPFITTAACDAILA